MAVQPSVVVVSGTNTSLSPGGSGAKDSVPVAGSWLPPVTRMTHPGAVEQSTVMTPGGAPSEGGGGPGEQAKTAHWNIVDTMTYIDTVPVASAIAEPLPCWSLPTQLIEGSIAAPLFAHSVAVYSTPETKPLPTTCTTSGSASPVLGVMVTVPRGDDAVVGP